MLGGHHSSCGVLGLSSGGFLPVSLLIKLYNCEIFRSSFPYKPDQFYSSLSELQELPALFRRFFEKNHEDMIMILIRSIPCLVYSVEILVSFTMYTDSPERNSSI